MTSPVVALVGFPTDSNSSFRRGAARGSAAIRVALSSEAGNSFAESGLDTHHDGVMADAGDLPMTETSADRDAIERSIADHLQRSKAVLSLGGDHSITYPIVRAFASRYPNLSIVHIDAHPDLYPIFQDNRYSHACAFARILEDTSAARLVQVGIRTMSDPQRDVAQRFGVLDFSPARLTEAHAALPRGPVYVSLDLDGLDPAFAPGVSHREPGGLSVREVLELVRAIPGPVVGADIVELNPDEDVSGMTALVGAKFVKEFVARLYADASN